MHGPAPAYRLAPGDPLSCRVNVVQASNLQRHARNAAALRVAALLSLLGSCTVTGPNTALRIPLTTADVATVPSIVDGRARYRALFCAVLSNSEPGAPERRCDDILWRLPGEAPPLPAATGPSVLDPHMRLLIVGGAFSDCFPPASTAFFRSATQLRKMGLTVEYAAISGRSSSEFNARIIATHIAALPANGRGPLVVVAHSKGTADVLETLARYPETASRVAAVVSVAGAVNGSPLADLYPGLYDRLFGTRAIGRCPAGDGAFLTSLRPSTRRAWLTDNTLPGSVRFYSMAAFTTPARLARALTYPQQRLSRFDARNDGQLLALDQLIPGSTLLGYLNEDHWAVAVSIEDAFPVLAHRPVGPHPLPQQAMLEAILLLVQQDLAAGAAFGSALTRADAGNILGD